MKQPAEVASAYQAWDKIVANPTGLTDGIDQRLIFTAGGALPSQFGNTESEIWRLVQKKFTMLESEGKPAQITIAGVNFSSQELELLGDFYRWIGQKERGGHQAHCIDERLQDNLVHVNCQVHQACGACAALTEAVESTVPLEDTLASAVSDGEKQPIFDGMDEHNSITIFVDLSGKGMPNAELLGSLKDKHALAFNVSLPLNQIAEYLMVRKKPNAYDQAQILIATLVKWNVQIARNIIGGNHNALHEQADHAQIIVRNESTTLDPSQHPLLEFVRSELGKVGDQSPKGRVVYFN